MTNPTRAGLELQNKSTVQRSNGKDRIHSALQIWRKPRPYAPGFENADNKGNYLSFRTPQTVLIQPLLLTAEPTRLEAGFSVFAGLVAFEGAACSSSSFRVIIDFCW